MKYVTTIHPVREITLIGTAQLNHWRERLKREALTPYDHHGRAIVLLSAVHAKYKGIPFQEFSISVQVGENRFFLAHAYNSLRAFAFAERVLFQTPYYPAKLSVETCCLKVIQGSTTVFEAALPPDMPCLREGHEGATIQLHLPEKLRKQKEARHFFYAYLEGYTQSYSAHAARIMITPPDEAGNVFELLCNSGFQVEEWRVREQARHSKSRTYIGKL